MQHLQSKHLKCTLQKSIIRLIIRILTHYSFSIINPFVDNWLGQINKPYPNMETHRNPHVEICCVLVRLSKMALFVRKVSSMGKQYSFYALRWLYFFEISSNKLLSMFFEVHFYWMAQETIEQWISLMKTNNGSIFE